jgi:hypothetical protein
MTDHSLIIANNIVASRAFLSVLLVEKWENLKITQDLPQIPDFFIHHIGEIIFRGFLQRSQDWGFTDNPPPSQKYSTGGWGILGFKLVGGYPAGEDR